MFFKKWISNKKRVFETNQIETNIYNIIVYSMYMYVTFQIQSSKAKIQFQIKGEFLVLFVNVF